MGTQEVSKQQLDLLPQMPSCAIESSACNADGNRRPDQVFQEYVYNFAYGSNIFPPATLLKRGKVKFESFELARLRGWRLAFTFRSLPPVEPAFGSIEPLGEPGSNFAVHANDRCMYGALIKLKCEEYHKLWLSEGGALSPAQYEEVVVPCELESGEVVEAVAFRTGATKFVPYDVIPSARYREIICSGARQLGVPTGYQEALERIPVLPPLAPPLQKLADPAIRLIFRIETMNSPLMTSMPFKSVRVFVAKAFILYGHLIHSQRAYLLRIAVPSGSQPTTKGSPRRPVAAAVTAFSNAVTLLQLMPFFAAGKLVSASISFLTSCSWIQ